MEIVLVIEMSMASGLIWLNGESWHMILAIAMASHGKILCWTRGHEQ
jgi:hypothetical protein